MNTLLIWLLVSTIAVLLGGCRSDDGSVSPDVDKVVVLDLPPQEESDPFDLIEASQQGDTAVVLVRYSGGCQEHLCSVYWNGSVAESLPPQVIVDIYHDGQGDTCEAYPLDTVRFSLNEVLRDAWSLEEELRLIIRNAHSQETLSLLIENN